MENKENLLGVLKTLFEYRKTFLRYVGIVFIGSIIISLLLPTYYKSTTVFYAASPDFTNPDKMFGGGSTDMRYFGTSEDIDRLLTIASGGELVNAMVKQFNLYENYDIDSTSEKAAFNVQEHFNSLYSVEKTKYDAIEITVEDRDRELCAKIANAARNEIEKINLRLAKESQSQQLEAVKFALEGGEHQLKMLGDSLIGLRKKYTIYDVESKGETLSGLLAESEMKKSLLEGKLEAYKAASGVKRDSIRKTNIALKGTESLLEKLKEDIDLFNEGSSLVQILNEQHEKARIQVSWDKERLKRIQAAYKSESPIIHLVEEAPIPIVKSYPIRSMIVIVSSLVTIIFLVLGILVFENYKATDWREVFNTDSK